MYPLRGWQQNTRLSLELCQAFAIESDGELRAAILGTLFVHHGTEPIQPRAGLLRARR